MFDIPCVILCGGKSSRMGEDKSLLPFGGSNTLAEFQYDRLKKIFKSVYISCKNPNKYDFDAEFIEDEGEEFNPFLGIKSSFNYTGLPYLFFIPVDSPFVSEDVISKIFKSFDCSLDIAIPKDKDGTHNLIGIYSSSLIPKIAELESEGVLRVGALLKKSKSKIVDFEDSHPFTNLNYKEEYEKVINLLH